MSLIDWTLEKLFSWLHINFLDCLRMTFTKQLFHLIVKLPIFLLLKHLKRSVLANKLIYKCGSSDPGYGDLTLASAELEEVKSLSILGVTFNYKLIFEMHLREVVSKAARNLRVVCRAKKLFAYLRVLKGCFYAYVLNSLEYCAPVWTLSAEFHLRLLHSIVRSAEKLCEGELCCLVHKRKGSFLCLLYKIYHRMDHSMNEYLRNLFAARSTRVSAALG